MKYSLASQLGKAAPEIQRSDIVAFIRQNEIKTLCFQYLDLESEIREILIPINSTEYAHRILASGERIDGSSIFKGIIPSGESDLYIVPLYQTAYMNPFMENTLNIVCNFLNRDEKLAAFTPANILKNEAKDILNKHGLELWALGELEFYLLGEEQFSDFVLEKQKGYHRSTPYTKYRDIASEIGQIMAGITGAVKYVHAEVGYISDLEKNGKKYHAEQYEVEFLPEPISNAALTVSLTKWVTENVAAQYGVNVSFTPKLMEGHAGTGLHFHLELLRDSNNIMRDKSGEISKEARAMIASLCEYGPSLTAVGNRSKASYERLVPNQESPTSVYWNELDRNALLRIPLAWKNGEDLASVINENNRESYHSPYHRQTVELRSADTSGHHYFLLAGIARAVNHGLSNIERYSKMAADYGKPSKDPQRQLPASCDLSVKKFRDSASLYKGLFSDKIMDYIVTTLENAE